MKWTINPNENNNYQNKLDEALLSAGQPPPTDDKIDIFLIEADYALKYVDSEYTLDVKGDIGLTDDDLTGPVPVHQGHRHRRWQVQKGATWQATPGLFAYRRSIAKDVLGTDDPDRSAGCTELIGTSSTLWPSRPLRRATRCSPATTIPTAPSPTTCPLGWVDGTTVKVGRQPDEAGLTRPRTYTDNGYNNKTSLWSDQWAADQGPSGKVFGFFYSTWGINFTLLGNSLETPDARGRQGRSWQRHLRRLRSLPGPAALLLGRHLDLRCCRHRQHPPPSRTLCTL